jgi:hypothetical protein
MIFILKKHRLSKTSLSIVKHNNILTKSFTFLKKHI